MREILGKSVLAILAGTFVANLASAHPGHSPADVAAEVSQPFAGADHFVVFIALASMLLLALRLVLSVRNAKAGEMKTTGNRLAGSSH
jgi:hydrogenase/urease accessory protein HupE